MDLRLGTVQFGLDYGIRNQKKVKKEEAIICLDYAVHNGITAIDTAAAYGNAEEVLGDFLAMKTIEREKLSISTKLKPNILDDYEEKDYLSIIKCNLEKTLSVLNTNYVDAYLLHSSRYAFRPDIISALAEVKKLGLAKKVGVSVYDPEEARVCLENRDVEFIQLPYSIFDHRMKEAGIFENNPNCIIDSRSAFIQGLITMKPEEVPDFLKEAKPIMEKINKISKETGLSPIELAMAYVKREKAISHLVFGVNSLEELKEDIQAFQKDVPENILKEIEKEFSGINARIVIPSLWKK